VTSTGSRSFEIKDGASEEKLSGTVEPKFDWKAHNTELTGKLSTLGEFEGGFSIKDLATKGTKFGVNFLRSDKDGNALKSSIAWKNDLVSVKAGVKYPFKTKTYINWNGEAVVRYPESLYWGVDLRFDSAIREPDLNTPESEQPKNQLFWNAKGSYVSGNNQVTLGFENVANKDKKTNKANPSLSSVTIGFYRVINDSFKLALGVNHEVKQLKGTEVTLGGEYKLDKDSLLKSKIGFVDAKDNADREIRLGLGLKQNLSENCTATLGADVNVRAVFARPDTKLGSTKPTPCGIEIKLNQ